jgi:sec-independent protein translocase protein TatA
VALALLNIGPIEILLVLGAAVLLFGGDLPETARKLGTFMARARSAANDIKRTVYEAEAEEKTIRQLPPVSEPTVRPPEPKALAPDTDPDADVSKRETPRDDVKPDDGSETPTV